MSTAIPQDIRDEVQRMREALRTAVRRSHLVDVPQIEQALGTSGAELRVAQVFRVLHAIGVEPWRFFLALREAEEGQGEHDAA
jgi:hypothetical protein